MGASLLFENPLVRGLSDNNANENSFPVDPWDDYHEQSTMASPNVPAYKLLNQYLLFVVVLALCLFISFMFGFGISFFTRFFLGIR